MPRLSKIGAAALAAFGWTSGVSAVTVDFLVVAGGAGGAGAIGGGGGAGGFRTSAGTSGGGASAEAKLSLNPTESYTVIVGAGGPGAVGSTFTTGVDGSNSVFSTITSIGGGGGGTEYGNLNGRNGGSGGGGGEDGDSGGGTSGGSGTTNQGFAGGSWQDIGSGGGGGGASAVGVRNGGAGVPSSITGSAVTYAGGGGAGARTDIGGSAGTGGAGGGGDGSTTGDGNPGAANRGAGGGGGSFGVAAGGQGGSGVVIISYPSPQQFGGGVVTVSGGNTIHTFTTSGTLSPLSSLTASCLVVAGGGGAGGVSNDASGGGGAGGYRTGSGITIDTNSIYAITVGAGGAGGAGGAANNGTSGSNSVFYSITSTGGGYGGGGSGGGAVSNNGGSGGSGGGASNNPSTGGAGNTPSTSPSQGNNGGAPYGGGGGASGAGTATAFNGANNGGAGSASSISGASVNYAGGGCSGGSQGNTFGGGNGETGPGNANNTAGTANTGGGGGGCWNSGSRAGAAGGSGVVIISYPGTSQQMAGGTVTVAGGNVIHTFTSSGYLTPIVLVNNSLRFRNSASAYLSRTPTTTGNQQKFTYSAWVKLGQLSMSGGNYLFSAVSSSVTDAIRFTSGNNLQFFLGGAGTAQLVSTAVYRDVSAWYHVVVSVDTTQTTASNRVRMYVNGVEITSFSTSNYPSQNTNCAAFNVSGKLHTIGNDAQLANYADEYLDEINFIDGQQLTPNSFGTFNGLGVWQPIRYGGSYGTNGFYLPFTATQSFTGIFSGSSQWISVPNLAAYNVGTNNYTVEGWFYITSLGSTQGLWGSNNGSGSTPKFLGLVNTSGAVLLEFTNSGGATFLTSSSGVVTTNKWHHIAWVRNSGTSTIYVNGVNVGSTATSVNLSGLTQPWNIGYIGESGPSSLTGNASNFRLVTGTAVYTSNFIPQTTPLTAISGTQILTLQNATLVDNSTNAQTVTNTGGVTVGATYPFAMLNDVVKDFGPAGNNWTANNIGETTGSTLDTMTDVPTLTSTTTANYCVWNPLNKSSTQNVTNGNLTASSSGGTSYGALCATMGVTSGKWYWEMTYTRNGSTNSPVIGFGNDLFNYTNPPGGYLGSDLNAGGINVFNGNAAINGTSTAYGSAIASNDVVMFAMDLDNRKFYVGKNGTWFNSGNPVSGTNSWPYSATIVGSTFFPAVNMFNDSAATNFGQQPWVYTPPTGFVALNTFNLPTPTIGATASTTANKYMDNLIWTGNGTSTRTLTGLNFQPDFVWTKTRSNAYYHNLYDVVRGFGSAKSLHSNSTDSEGTLDLTYGYVSAATSTGFSVANGNTNGAYVNENSATYVAWNWKANGTGVTNTSGSITSTVSANTTAGFSIVTYTGNGTNGATVGHGLGVAPSLMFVKDRSQGGTYRDWAVYSPIIGAGNSMYLNSTSGSFSKPSYWNSTTATSTVFTLGNDITVNQSGDAFVAYCFAQIAGYSAFGSYTGNGSSDGPFIFTGFRPRFVLLKVSSGTTANWVIVDTSRNTYNVANSQLNPDSADAEFSGSNIIDIVSNGFKLRNTPSTFNGNGNTYIYMAFCESPFKFSNAR